MCGKCKYGLGDSRKRRQQWIFGGVSRNTGRMFLSLCPENKENKEGLMADRAGFCGAFDHAVHGRVAR